jgi:predicted hotdog family 3-hydroxylacyl-ACP dehydratase
MITSTQELLEFLPHRAPMVWIDEVGEISEFRSECFVTLKANGLYFSNGVLRRTSLIEFIAQGFGYQAAASALRSGAQPPRAAKAFLASVSKCVLSSTESLKPGDRLRIVLENAKSIGPITLFSGQVIGQNGQEYCSASLKVFSQPESPLGGLQ